MKKLIDDPNAVACEAPDGLALAHPRNPKKRQAYPGGHTPEAPVAPRLGNHPKPAIENYLSGWDGSLNELSSILGSKHKPALWISFQLPSAITYLENLK